MTEDFFSITSVHRDDMKNCFETHKNKDEIFKIIDALTDWEMQAIAERMADDYLEQLYWHSLKAIFESVLEEKEKQIEKMSGVKRK